MSGSSEFASDAAGWVIRAGLEGADELDLLHGFCERLVRSGVPVRRALVLVDTIHPVHEGRVFRWRADHGGEEVEYGRSSEDQQVARRWRESPFHALDQAGVSQLRFKIASGEGDRFGVTSELRAEGQTDCLACAHRFSPA